MSRRRLQRQLISDLFSRARDDETGLTLVEVMIAMMIFAMIAVGIAFTMASSLVTTRDARAREVAANLAATDIDTVRAVTDVAAVLNLTKSTTVDGVVYTLARTTGWISGSGSDSSCGSGGGGALLYKHVNERVTWAGARTKTSVVRSDTLVAPRGRLTDPAFGSLLISAVGSTGVGVAAITVTAVPSATNPNGAIAPASLPAPTDSEGCSYIFKASPGNYDVTLNSPGGTYRSDGESAAPVQYGVTVIAGDSTSAVFQYDVASTFVLTLGASDPAADILIPSGLTVDFAGDAGLYSTVVTVPPSRVISTPLYPASSGYSLFTGAYVSAPANATATTGASSQSCVSPDPGAWTTPNSAGVIGHRSAAVAALPGSTVSGFVPMGLVTVQTVAQHYLTAVSATASASVGDPGCSTALGMTYSFASAATAVSTRLALPFGTWVLYSGSTVGAQTTLVPSTSITLPPGSPSNAAPGVFTLDPRVANQ